MLPHLTGADIKRLRLAAGMSQRDLAQGIVTAAYLSLIESGKRAPSESVLVALAARLGVDPAHHAALHGGLRRMMAALLAGERTQAEADLRSALDIDPQSAPARLMQARWDESNEFYGVAQSAYQDLCEEFEQGSQEHLWAVLGCCRCARATGLTELAVRAGMRALKATSQSSVDGDSVIELRGTVAGLLAGRGDFDEALRVVRLRHPLIQESPWATVTAKWVESSTFQRTGQLDLALMAAREAMAAAEEVNRPLSLAKLKIVNAVLELREPEVDAARVRALVDSAESVFRQFRTSVDLSLCAVARASLTSLEEGMERALPEFHAAIEELLRHNRVQAVQVMTTVGERCTAAGLAHEAVLVLRRAMDELAKCDLNAANARAWSALGKAHEDLGDVAEALTCMKKAAEAAGLTGYTRLPQSQKVVTG